MMRSNGGQIGSFPPSPPLSEASARVTVGVGGALAWGGGVNLIFGFKFVSAVAAMAFASDQVHSEGGTLQSNSRTCTVPHPDEDMCTVFA